MAADSVAHEPHVPVGTIGDICQVDRLQIVENVPARQPDQGAYDPVCSHRRDTGKTDRAAASDQKHQHQFGVVVRLMPQRNFVEMIPGRDVIVKCIAPQPGSLLERQPVSVPVAGNILLFYVAGEPKAG